MADVTTNAFLRRLREGLGPEGEEAATDGQLLERFVARRDESAFEALLRRHGPMVLAVCRRLLPGGPDSEDAFQAAFLLLVRKAGAIARGESVAGWLHGVAYAAPSRRGRWPGPAGIGRDP
jgi:RNA polymerase sigma-70 factor (ECF subfamily)